MNLASIGKNILDFLFPKKCIVCKKEGEIICEQCFLKIPKDKQDKFNILSVYKYREVAVNKLLWKLKYHHESAVAEVFGKALAEEIKNWLVDFPENFEIYLIPMPLNQKDIRLNNHAELLAKAINKNLENSKVLNNMFIKTNKKKQARTKNKKERIKNIENSILINKKYIENLQILNFEKSILIIVDDVVTTGATILEAKSTLSEYLKLNEENILAVTVAH